MKASQRRARWDGVLRPLWRWRHPDRLAAPGLGLPGSPLQPHVHKTKYLGISDHMELQILLQLVLVVLFEKEIPLFRG